mgnify:FL=1
MFELEPVHQLNLNGLFLRDIYLVVPKLVFENLSFSIESNCPSPVQIDEEHVEESNRKSQP